jgi:hypothetical protein
VVDLSKEEYDELLNIFLEVDESGLNLGEREHRFFEDQRLRVERYKQKVYMSVAQWAWLRDIHKRATQ